MLRRWRIYVIKGCLLLHHFIVELRGTPPHSCTHVVKEGLKVCWTSVDEYVSLILKRKEEKCN